VHALRRLRRAWWGVRQELTWGWRHVARGRPGYLVGVLYYRALAVWPGIPGAGRACEMVTDRGCVVHYRRVRGDLQGIREVFIDEIYRLPAGARPGSLVDLGANIGLATVWLAKEYGIEALAAFEPLAANLEVLRRNCEANALRVDVRAAALGARDGSASFDVGEGANLGRVARGGAVLVAVAGIAGAVGSLGFAPSLLKMDVEGAEGELLLEADPSWIRAFELVVAELHPQYVELGRVIDAVVAQGFRYYPPTQESHGTQRANRERLFVRDDVDVRR